MSTNKPINPFGTDFEENDKYYDIHFIAVAVFKNSNEQDIKGTIMDAVHDGDFDAFEPMPAEKYRQELNAHGDKITLTLLKE